MTQHIWMPGQHWLWFLTKSTPANPFVSNIDSKCHSNTANNYQLVTVYPKKYAHGFVVLCFVVVMQSFIMNSHEAFIHIHQGCFAGTGAIVRLPQCQWSKPDGYGKTSQCITTTKHSKAKTVCIFLGIYCMCLFILCMYSLDDSSCLRQRAWLLWWEGILHGIFVKGSSN